MILSRPLLFSFSSSPTFLASIRKYIELFPDERLTHDFSEENELVHQRIEDIFTYLDKVHLSLLPHSACVIDLCGELNESWRINRDKSPGLRITDLVLSFPEVYFIFIVDERPSVNIFSRQTTDLHFIEKNNISELPSLLVRHQMGFRNFFDASGLRNMIRSDENQNDGNENVRLGERFSGENKPTVLKAATIDEEKDFLYLNGYALYSYGYEVNMVPSLFEMEKLFRQNSDYRPGIVLEDCDIRFGDANDNKSTEFGLTVSNNSDDIEWMNKRNHHFDGLERLKRQSSQNKSSSTMGVRVLVSSKSEMKDYSLITKPYAGILDSNIREQVCKSLGETDSNKYVRKRLRCVDNGRDEKNGHSAEHNRQVVAASLLDRAERIKENTSSVEEAVHGAILALDAWLLLEGNTQAMSLQAIHLRSTFEVIAECTFLGNSQKLDSEHRLAELKSCVKDTVKRNVSNGVKIDDPVNNVLVKMYNSLRIAYKDFEQFEQEETTLKKVRWLMPLVQYGREYKSPLKYVIKPSQLYLVWLVNNFANILLASTSIIIVFSILFHCLGIEELQTAFPDCRKYELSKIGACSDCKEFDLSKMDAFSMSFKTYVALDAGEVVDLTKLMRENNIQGATIIKALAILEMLLGVLHLSILVAYLFQKVSRK